MAEQKKQDLIVVWLRNDLRLCDNPVLTFAASQAAERSSKVLPVFCFDPRFVTEAQPQFLIPCKTGKHRLRFMVESVDDLRN